MEFKVFIICEVLCVVLSSVLGAPASDHDVAFSVGLTNTLHIQDQSRIIFDEVLINKKNGYDKSTGVFTAPLPGAYVFHFSAYSSNVDMVMWLELQYNDQPKASLSGYNSHTVGSNTVILNLKPGDRVDIKSRPGQHFSLFGLPDQIYSTFTGFMLYPTSIYMDHTVG